MILIQNLRNFKAQNQGFVINRNKPIMLFTPVSRYIKKERKRKYSQTWRTEHKEFRSQIIKGLRIDGIKKIVGTEKLI